MVDIRGGQIEKERFFLVAVQPTGCFFREQRGGSFIVINFMRFRCAGKGIRRLATRFRRECRRGGGRTVCRVAQGAFALCANPERGPGGRTRIDSSGQHGGCKTAVSGKGHGGDFRARERAQQQRHYRT